MKVKETKGDFKAKWGEIQSAWRVHIGKTADSRGTMFRPKSHSRSSHLPRHLSLPLSPPLSPHRWIADSVMEGSRAADARVQQLDMLPQHRAGRPRPSESV